MKFHNKRVSILSDPSMITMLTNDFGYDKAYQKFLEYYVEKDTLVIIMSSGGESDNMYHCLDWCEGIKFHMEFLQGLISIIVSDLKQKMHYGTTILIVKVMGLSNPVTKFFFME